MSIVIAAVILFLLALAYVRIGHWLEDRRRTRFVFEEREEYLFLKLDRPLRDAQSGLVSMMALREALLLKVARAGSQRVLVQVSSLRLANQRAFWLLIGGIGPLLVNETVRLAVVCGRRSTAAKHFRKQGILKTFPSVREGERYLKSAEPRQTVPLDRERVDALLVSRGRRAA